MLVLFIRDSGLMDLRREEGLCLWMLVLFIRNSGLMDQDMEGILEIACVFFFLNFGLLLVQAAALM